MANAGSSAQLFVWYCQSAKGWNLALDWTEQLTTTLVKLKNIFEKQNDVSIEIYFRLFVQFPQLSIGL